MDCSWIGIKEEMHGEHSIVHAAHSVWVKERLGIIKKFRRTACCNVSLVVRTKPSPNDLLGSNLWISAPLPSSSNLRGFAFASMTFVFGTTQAAKGEKRERDQLANEIAKTQKKMETLGGGALQGRRDTCPRPRFSLQNCATPTVR